MFSSIRTTEALVAFAAAAACDSTAPAGITRKDLDDMFRTCHPFREDAALQRLAAAAVQATSLDAKRSACTALQAHLALHRDVMAQYTRARETILTQFASVLALTADGDGAGVSNRWRLRKSVDARFTASAGVTLDPTATRDVHGNAAGTAFDLGRDGAFDDCKLVMYSQYTSEGLPEALQRRVRPVLCQKGFDVVIVHNGLELLAQLPTASQLWLVSTSYEVLNDDVLSAIVTEWRTRGLGVYVLGDNEPYYYDANRLLHRMGLPTMSGNYYGHKHVLASASTGGRVVPGLVTTGINRLYEGITIAHFEEKTVSLCSGNVVYYNSEGRPSVVAYDADGTAGPVIADGAFTKLFVNWDSAGSARLVCNSACYLAAFARAQPEPEPEPEPEAPECTSYDFTGAFCGECAITMEDDTPLALLAEALQEPLTDDSINNPLATGAMASRALSPHPYSFRAAQSFMTGASDPFYTLAAATAIFPAVDLSIRGNLQLLSATACQVFFGGKEFPRLACLMLFAAVDTLLVRGAGNAAMLTFMRNQLLANVLVARDFGLSSGSAPTPPLPLREAMACFVADDALNLLRGPCTAALMIRVLHDSAVEAGDVLVALLRRAYIYHVVSLLRCNPRDICQHLRTVLLASCFEQEVGNIPVMNTAFLPASLRGIESDARLAGPDLVALYTAAAALGLAHPAGSEATACAALWALSSDDMLSVFRSGQTTLKSLAELQKLELGARVWSGTVSVDDVVRELNGIYTAKFVVEVVPVFATCSGCSVLFGIGDEGVKTPFFEDGVVAFNKQEIAAAEARRRSWLRERYAGTTVNGVPAKCSDCFALHFHVAAVMRGTSGMLSALEIASKVQTIAERLKKDGRGAFACRGLGHIIQELIKSYLALRLAGAKEFERPSFATLVEEELRLRSMGLPLDGFLHWSVL